jgi:5-methylcytosine-specific restriction endonuclease McrA
MTPIVTGDLDVSVLDDLVRLGAHLDRLRRDGTAADATRAQDTLPVQDILEQEIIGKAVALLSGPGGLASFLRRRQLGTRLAGHSLPLDVGVSTDIPAAIRRAVIERDQHCRFPNGCDQPAAGCEVHHLTHKADGGKTSVKDCILFCTHHHQVEIHRNGWTVALNPDGTTTAWNKDRTKTLHSHSHSPPPRPG